MTESPPLSPITSRHKPIRVLDSPTERKSPILVDSCSSSQHHSRSASPASSVVIVDQPQSRFPAKLDKQGSLASLVSSNASPQSSTVTLFPPNTPQVAGNPRALSKDQRSRFNLFVVKAKACQKEEDLEGELANYMEAAKIHENEQVRNKIAKLQRRLGASAPVMLESGFCRDDVTELCSLKGGFSISTVAYDNMFPHQRQGVAWLWGLHMTCSGGILGDDMGLGKTVQISAFIEGLMSSNLTRTVLIVVPVSLMPNWVKELQAWAPDTRVKEYYGTNKKERERNLEKIRSKKGVLLTSYGMIASNTADFIGNQGHVWDYVILDEGHKIKNPSSQISKCLHSIPAQQRIILSGTPIQNSLDEMWALFDFACQGKLLGTMQEFKDMFSCHIVKATDKDATIDQQNKGAKVAQALRTLIEPHFLRRDKASVFGVTGQSTATATVTSSTTTATSETRSQMTAQSITSTTSEGIPSSLTLQRKNDFIVWVYLTSAQKRVYETFLESDKVRQLLNTTMSPLAALTVLKKVCDHPLLLLNYLTFRKHLGLESALHDNGNNNNGSDSNKDVDVDGDVNDKVQAGLVDELQHSLPTVDYTDLSPKELIGMCGKLEFLVTLMYNLRDQGHRVLVFSQSRKMLDIIAKVLEDFKIMRIDGTITNPIDRQQRVDTFNNDSSFFACLLTSQVGGVGLTLTGANRVVIFDPSWNPATDAQAVDRAYRIGQQKNVIIYRLITCGTIEEKIYCRQIFKNSLMRTATKSAKPFGYFSKTEMRDLFTLDNTRFSKTQKQLAELHGDEYVSDADLEAHISFLHTLPMFGLSHHDRMFTKALEEKQESSPNDDGLLEKTRAGLNRIQQEIDNRDSGFIDTANIVPPTSRSSSRSQLLTQPVEQTSTVAAPAVQVGFVAANVIPMSQPDIITLDDEDTDDHVGKNRFGKMRQSMDDAIEIEDDEDTRDVTVIDEDNNTVTLTEPLDVAPITIEADDDCVRRCGEDWSDPMCDIIQSNIQPINESTLDALRAKFVATTLEMPKLDDFDIREHQQRFDEVDYDLDNCRRSSQDYNDPFHDEENPYIQPVNVNFAMTSSGVQPLLSSPSSKYSHVDSITEGLANTWPQLGLDHLRRYGEDHNDLQHDFPTNIQPLESSRKQHQFNSDDDIDRRRRHSEDFNDVEHDIDFIDIQPVEMIGRPFKRPPMDIDLDCRRRLSEDFNDPEHEDEPSNLQPLSMGQSSSEMVIDDDDRHFGRRHSEDMNDPEHDNVEFCIQPVAMTQRPFKTNHDIDEIDLDTKRRHSEDWNDMDHEDEPEHLQHVEFATPIATPHRSPKYSSPKQQGSATSISSLPAIAEGIEDVEEARNAAIKFLIDEAPSPSKRTSTVPPRLSVRGSSSVNVIELQSSSDDDDDNTQHSEQSTYFDAEDDSTNNNVIVVDDADDDNERDNKQQIIEPIVIDNQTFTSPMAYLLSPRNNRKECDKIHSKLVHVTKCRCFGVDERRLQEYVELLRREEENGNLSEALRAGLDALDVCDEDEWLHAKVLAFATQLGVA